MKQVAVISQTLRLGHCQAYLNREGPSESVILTADPSSFTDLHFRSPVRVVPVSPPPELLPTTRLVTGRVFRRLVARARSGSRFGRWLEKMARKLVWRLRYLDRIVVLKRRQRPRAIDPKSFQDSALFQELSAEHDETPIDRIVVFDVFDLPVVLEFAGRHDIDVAVR
ncbi:MAG: hypothetical protein ACRDU9_05245 [Acidimicrobiia bacterium]